jgi:hypothetical protein
MVGCFNPAERLENIYTLDQMSPARNAFFSSLKNAEFIVRTNLPSTLNSAFEIFLRRPPQIWEYRLLKSGGVSPIDGSALFSERGQADLHRSVT